MSIEFDFEHVDFITVGTIGAPGQRVFHLQAGQASRLLTLTVEKEQAAALAESITALLAEVEQQFQRPTPDQAQAEYDLDLREPILPAFRVAQMGIGYDSDNDRVVLILNELVPEDSPQEPRSARIGASREQMFMLSAHAREVVAGGRPICGNCGRPIDPDGHFCPPSNGHRKPVEWA